MTLTRFVAYCSHCNHETYQIARLTQDYWEKCQASDGTQVMVPGTYFVCVCEGCEQVLLYGKFPGHREADVLPDAELLWPERRELPSVVPERIRAIYREASAVRDASPNAFAVSIRRALEAVCEDRHAVGSSLAKRLEVLAERGDVPPLLAEMTEVLRVLGNLGAHADTDVRSEHVLAIDDFFRTVVSYVYVGPTKLQEFRKHLDVSDDGTIH